MRPHLALSSAFAMLLAANPAPALQAPAIQRFFKANDATFFNGGLLIVRGSAPVSRVSTGFAQFNGKRPNTPDSVFQLASAAKPFTSTAVLQLRDRRLLRLDDPVAKHLPGFPYPAITIRHLLTHTSGLPDLELFEPLVAKEPNRVVSGA